MMKQPKILNSSLQRSGLIPGHYNMILRVILVLTLFLPMSRGVFGQVQCTTLGQNPSTAFPVCGVSVFNQSTVPLCGGRRIPGACNSDPLTDVNPFYYKFTCFTGGTLGFTVTPIDLNDDYDWQIFDVTGRNPDDIFTDASLFVACNWSGNAGTTGASAAGTSLVNCAGYTYPTFSSMPTLIKDHEYILLLSNFSASQKGYQLAFGGGTASITDPKIPLPSYGSSQCGGTQIGLKLNKKMKCSTVAANGSDFMLSTPLANIISASPVGCSTGFDTDSVVIRLDNTLSPGIYSLSLKLGSDGNSILDYCDRGIAVGEKIDFEVFAYQPTTMDSLKRLGCGPLLLELFFPTGILCSSIAADGSDFSVTGPSPVTIVSASGNCTGTSTKSIMVSLSQPIVVGGTYTITLKQGSDGNSITDECTVQVPIGSKLDFQVADTVSADFTFQQALGCRNDTLYLFHDGRNSVNSWAWTSNGTPAANTQNPTLYYTVFGSKNIGLKVSNGVCTDSAEQSILLDNVLEAAFDYTDVVCPEDFALFTDKSIGKIQSWNWQFGNSFSSNQQQPDPQKYPPPSIGREQLFSARLIVQDIYNCSDTITHSIKSVATCKIAVPNAFTPNNDGRNDFLYPLNAYKADNLIFRVFNRVGQLVFETRDWTRKWDGTINGKPQSGSFVWVLQYIDHDTGRPVLKKGTTVIIR